jgi:hypothetical protein
MWFPICTKFVTVKYMDLSSLYSDIIRMCTSLYGPSYPKCTVSCIPGLNRQKRDGDYGAEVKNGGVIPQFPIRLHGVMLN